MERLTKKIGEYIVFPSELVGVELTPDNSTMRSLLQRLSAYEDTGLMPAEVLSMKMDMAIINAMFQNADVERMEELAKADKGGRLVLLPCKPLDTVYSLFCGEIVEKRIGAITINGYTNPRIWVELYCGFLATQTKRWDLAVGKEFYLTREEAETALKGDAE